MCSFLLTPFVTTRMANETLHRSKLDYLTMEFRYTFGVLFIFTTFGATLQNGVVLILSIRQKKLRTPTHIIVATLTFVDFLLGVIVAPLNALQLLSQGFINDVTVDHTREYLSSVLVMVSANLIVFIGVDRYLHLRKLSSYKMETKHLYIILGLCFFLPFLVPVLGFVDENCVLFVVYIHLYVAMIVIIIIYSIIVFLLRYKPQSASLQAASAENQQRATITIIFILTCYILMDVPAAIHFTLKITTDLKNDAMAISYIVMDFLSVSNSLVNPFIYCYRTPVMRKKISCFFGSVVTRRQNKVRHCHKDPE